MLEFIQSQPQNLDKILNHLHSSAIMDLLLTLVRMEELPEGKGTVQVRAQRPGETYLVTTHPLCFVLFSTIYFSG